LQNAGAHTGIAAIFHRQQALNDAAFHYAEALRLQPNVADHHANLGHVLRDLQDLSVCSFYNKKTTNKKPR
jgi:Tfp pilus assembly protein PilF